MGETRMILVFKMYSLCFFVSLFSVLGYVFCGPAPCKLTDAKCLEKFGPTLYAMFFEADPKLGTEDLDPMHHNRIEGNLSGLNFTLTDITVEGFRNCKIENVKLNPAVLGLHSDMICPSLKMYGNYDMKGRLVVLPIEGIGALSINAKKYKITLDVELKLVDGKDGKTYAAVKNFKLNAEPLESVVYEFQNLFNGQKDLSDAVHTFANENWKEVANEIQGPVFNANFKKIIKNANKYLKSIPIQDLFEL